MLEIDMLEEPEDENDLIFLAHNENINGKYVYVVKNKLSQFRAAMASIDKIFANCFINPFVKKGD